MGETETLQVDSLQKTGQTSQEEKGSTSKATKTYTEEQVAKAVEKTRSDTLADAGREIKVYKEENITLKSQLATNQILYGRLEAQIDDLSKDDPDKLRLTAKLRELETLGEKLKLDQDSLTKAQEANRERLEKAEKFELGDMAKRIAGDYKDGNSDRLLAIALKLADRSEAELRAVADSIWEKKEPEAKPEPEESFTPDSGITSGGSMSDRTFIKGIGSGDIDVKIKENYDRAKKLGMV